MIPRQNVSVSDTAQTSGEGYSDVLYDHKISSDEILLSNTLLSTTTVKLQFGTNNKNNSNNNKT